MVRSAFCEDVWERWRFFFTLTFLSVFLLSLFPRHNLLFFFLVTFFLFSFYFSFSCLSRFSLPSFRAGFPTQTVLSFHSFLIFPSFFFSFSLYTSIILRLVPYFLFFCVFWVFFSLRFFFCVFFLVCDFFVFLFVIFFLVCVFFFLVCVFVVFFFLFTFYF